MIVIGLVDSQAPGRATMPYLRAAVSTTLPNAKPEHIKTVFIEEQPSTSSVDGTDILSIDDFIALPEYEKYFNVATVEGKKREFFASLLWKQKIAPIHIHHPSCSLSKNAQIGAGSLLSSHVSIAGTSSIGEFFQAFAYSFVGPDCRLGNFVSLAPRVFCNNNVIIDDYTTIGAGALLRPAHPDQPLRIGKGAIIGMGSVVTEDVPAGATFVGNPARMISPEH